MLAFNNDLQLKTDLLKQIILHREQDRIVSGSYGNFSDENFKGCAVGCSLHSYGIIKGIKIDTAKHSNYELFGIPRVLARLEDSIFESLPEKQQQLWPKQFMSAINVGADLSTVWPQFAVWLLVDKKWGIIKYAKNEQHKKAIQKVAELYKNGGTKQEFINAADAAYAYADAYDAYAAYAAARVTAAASATAASAAAYASAAASATGKYKARVAQSRKFISLLKACK